MELMWWWWRRRCCAAFSCTVFVVTFVTYQLLSTASRTSSTDASSFMASKPMDFLFLHDDEPPMIAVPTEPWLSGSSLCSPKETIVFLKTHKTAGSTVQNVFMRYGHRRGLTFVLPFRGNYLGHPYHFHTHMAPQLKPSYQYNILAHHARFNYASMRLLMPPDAVFVTILRDPVALFESLYSYYQLNRTFGQDLEEFVTSNFSTASLVHHDKRLVNKIGRNQMAFDLGLRRMFFEDNRAIRSMITDLDRQFHLVMIAERMEQSLILLRHLLCWSLDDVIAFRHNARTQASKVALSEELRLKIRQWNHADQLIYNHFQHKFEELETAFGRKRMEREVSALEARRRQWYNYCILGKAPVSKLNDKYKVYSSQVLGFQLNPDVRNETCEDLAKAELPFTKELLESQKQLYTQVPTAAPTTSPLIHNLKSLQLSFRLS